jgi:hypothetical protein
MVAKTRKSKPTQSGVDKILSHLPKQCGQEFRDWCWNKPSYTDMSRRLDQYIEEHPDCFEGLTEGEDYSRNLSINACYLWYQREYPVGEEVKEFNSMLRLYQGVEHDKIPQQLLVRMVRLCQTAMDRMADENLSGVESGVVFQTLPSVIREVRALSKLVDFQRKMETLHEDRMQAVQIAIMAVITTFKDQAGEEAVKAAAIDAMIEAERWSKNNLS